jgi:RNA polymerase sigma-70 factor (ECF subfamily)
VVALRALDFNEYFREQYPRLVIELDFILGDVDLARDVAQDAFVKQYVGWVRYSRYDKPSAWVRKIALQLAFKSRRKLFRNVPLETSPELPVPEVQSERAIDVRNAILQLSEAQRAAVVLHYYRDLPVAEVAKIMHCKEATAKVHLFKARSRLAEILISYKPT